MIVRSSLAAKVRLEKRQRRGGDMVQEALLHGPVWPKKRDTSLT